MSSQSTDRARVLRRRHRRERQAVVFGVLILALAVASLGSVAVYTGAIDAPFSRGFTTLEPDDPSTLAAAPCPPEGTLPVAYGAIQVNVLNGTERAGLATETAASLSGRGFVVVGTGNSPTSVSGIARISFGVSGVGAAYTLAAQLEGAALVLDARADATVDFAVGADFVGLLDPTAITLDAATPVLGVAGCVPLADAAQAPAPVGSTPQAPAAAG